MKKFLSGFLVGAVLFGTTGVFAAPLIAEIARFKILVNGVEFHSDPVPVVIEGRTFLPLRAMGNALGVSVEWNQELGQVEVGNSPSTPTPSTPIPTSPSTPTPTAVPFSRSNPAPFGTAQTIAAQYGINSGTVEVKVLDVIRGKEAEERIAAKSSSYDSRPPSEGYEYALIRLNMKILSFTRGDKLTPQSVEFDAYSDDNLNPKLPIVMLAPEPSFTSLGSLALGESTEGFIILQIKKGDEEPKLVCEFTNDGGIWFKLY